MIFLTFRSGVIPTINIELVVTNVYPLKGSLQGGTRLTITGLGFGSNDTEVEVDVGDFMCDVQSLSNTQIVCQIEEAARIHTVTNQGTHKGIYHEDKHVLNLFIFNITFQLFNILFAA